MITTIEDFREDVKKEIRFSRGVDEHDLGQWYLETDEIEVLLAPNYDSGFLGVTVPVSVKIDTKPVSVMLKLMSAELSDNCILAKYSVVACMPWDHGILTEEDFLKAEYQTEMWR